MSEAPSLIAISLIALCGGVLGVLFMVPLRNALIVKEHGVLPYPEGTACAEVLFGTVSSRMVGLVGSSNNPVSGMAIATLLFAAFAQKNTGEKRMRKERRRWAVLSGR